MGKQDEKSCIKIFQNLNVGKIPLTDSELIKALFFIKMKNKTENIDTKSQKTWENNFIYEWNKIEDDMQYDDLYYFLTKCKSTQPTNMDFLLRIIADQKNVSDKINQGQPYYTFYVFEKIINEKNDEPAIKLWDDVKKLFMTLQEWFYDNTYYHLIGYLIHKKNPNKIDDIIKLWNSAKSKADFQKKLREKIDQDIRIKIGQNKGKQNDIADLSYDDIADFSYYENKDDIVDTLLLFNIVSYMNSKDSRFPFKLYAEKKWSLEHIHAQKSEKLNSEQMKDILDEQKEYFSLEYKDKITKLLQEQEIDPEEFKKMQDEIFLEYQKEEYPLDNSNETFEDINSIDNLALLANEDNSSLSNNIFPIKRKKILDMDKDKKNDKFIPLCTKNVFLKYYSPDTTQIFKWTKKDRDNYLNVIIKTLEGIKNAGK